MCLKTCNLQEVPFIEVAGCLDVCIRQNQQGDRACGETSQGLCETLRVERTRRSGRQRYNNQAHLRQKETRPHSYILVAFLMKKKVRCRLGYTSHDPSHLGRLFSPASGKDAVVKIKGAMGLCSLQPLLSLMLRLVVATELGLPVSRLRSGGDGPCRDRDCEAAVSCLWLRAELNSGCRIRHGGDFEDSFVSLLSAIDSDTSMKQEHGQCSLCAGFGRLNLCNLKCFRVFVHDKRTESDWRSSLLFLEGEDHEL